MFDGEVEVPGSKSISNRALVLAALATGKTLIRNLQFSDDSKRMLESLKSLGFDIRWDQAAKTAEVQGLGGLIPRDSPALKGEALNVGNAGTAARFLPCLAALGSGNFHFKSDAAMEGRPMGELLTVLAEQGSATSPSRSAYPFTLAAGGLKGGRVSLDLSKSSQFASGLLMVAPYAASPLTLEILGEREQLPYVEITAAMMESFGIKVHRNGALWELPLGAYASPGEYLVEPDLSGAAYFFAAAALAGGKVTVRGARASSIQGDIRFLKVLQHMGCAFYEDPEGLTVEKEPGKVLKGVEVDMGAFSDQALTLAALAPFCDRPVTIRNVAHIRNQECDRIRAISKNLRMLGAEVEERPDGVTIQPGPLQGGVIETFGDHRVAMAFSLVGLKVPGISIDDPDCVSKTFKDYWSVLEGLQAGHD